MFDGKLLNLKPDDIAPRDDRSRKNFDEYELFKLSDSIKENGILQPLIVRPTGNGKFSLIAGEKRLRAAKMAGLKRVPCIIKKTDNITADCYTIIENLQRSNLTIFEEAEGISRLISCYGLTQSEIAGKIGIAQSILIKKLRLLKLSPAVRERITLAGLTERHARALLKLPEEAQSAALDLIIAKELNSYECEAYVDKLLDPTHEKREPVRKCVIGDVRLFANSLTKMVETMRTGGINAVTKRNETDTHIEYTVLITK